MTTPIRLWIDDERPMPDEYDVWAKTSAGALTVLERAARDGAPLGVVSFDHDLGGDDTTRRVMMWMAEHNIWPATVRIHTANSVGCEYLAGTARRYAPEGTRVVVAPVTARDVRSSTERR